MDKLPKGWKIVNWSDITLKIGDVDHKMPKENPDGYPYVSPRDFRPNNKIDFIGAKKISKQDYIELSKKIKPEKGDIIFARYGTIGENRFVETEMDFLASYSCAIIKHDLSKVLPEFSFYYSISPQVKLEIEKYINKATQPNIGIQSISKFLFPLPPLPEQTRIISKLDALFARIDKSIALLEENIKHAKALMVSVLEEVFHSSVKQISLSEIIVRTTNINPLLEPENKYTYIDITSVNNQLHQIENPKIIQGKDAPSRAKKSVIVGDIVFATTRPNLKNIAIVSNNFSSPVASTGFCVLRTKKGISNEFLFLCLLSNNIQEQINPFIRGAQYPAISDKDLLKCKIPDLAINKQTQITNKVMLLRNKLSSIKIAQQSKLTYLKALKSSLLDRAFKGDL